MGRFPITFIWGCKYIMLLLNWDINVILEKPLKYCAESELLRALTVLYKHVTDRGLQPHLHILDNKCSVGMQIFTLSSGTQHQLVPPGL